MLHDSSSFLVFFSALSDKWCIYFFLCVFRSIDCEYGCDCWFSAFLHLAGGAPSACSCAADGSIFFVGPPPAHNGACPSNVAVFAFLRLCLLLCRVSSGKIDQGPKSTLSPL